LFLFAHSTFVSLVGASAGPVSFDVRQEALMPPLFGHAGWGGIVETLACIFLCSAVWIVGFALAGAVFRSRVLVGLSFVLAVAVVANIELSSDGYRVWGIILLAPLAAAGSFLPNHRSDSPDDVERGGG
jgi:hypothetical protein